MDNHVVNLTLAKHLKAAGYPQESEFWWEESGENHPDQLLTCSGPVPDEGYAAPLATELLERLPSHIDKNGEAYNLVVDKFDDKTFDVTYEYYDTSTEIFSGGSLPDALAEMWLWLVENDYLSPTTLTH